jgi:valyl-tRNA synthetase
MASELPKTYDPTAIEAEAFRVWIDEKAFHAEASDPGEPYCIVIPPPNVTGALHLGHAVNNTLQDILTRVHRMRGYNALWMPGIDHAGIATQAVVEKQLKEKENLTRHDIGREALVDRIWQWKQQYGDRIIAQLKRLGCSCDWDRTRFTLDELCARAVRETFFKLFKDGLIYRGKRLVNWDVFLQTSISDDEIYHETVKTNLWHIRYPIVDAEGSGRRVEAEGSGFRVQNAESSPLNPEPRTLNPSAATYMVVATTRPETMLGDTAVAVHPDDPRWNWAIGKFVELPLTGRRIPIIGDAILVNMEFGSGCVKVTPAHDPNDYAVWQRQAGKIDIINILTPDGKINEAGGAYAGLKREVARKKIVEDLAAQGLLEKEEPYETQVGHSDRSKTPIEPYLSDQWFVKMAPLAEPALEVVRDGVIKFFPERHAQQYLSWLGEKRDWPISRQLWWGHRIPVWTKEVEAGADFMKAAKADRPVSILNAKEGDLLSDDGPIWGFARGIVNTESGRAFHTICVRELNPQIEKTLEERGYIQDPDVLDTWFSSALWPHSTLGWPEDTAELRKWYPTSVLLTDRGIITLWVARMVMTGIYNMQNHPAYLSKFTTESTEHTEKNNIKRNSSSVPSVSSVVKNPSAVPFHHVVINPTILDGKGERMSKSKGNGVDPVDIIETHGADALRFTLVQMATETQDVRIPVKKLADGRNTSEKFDVGRNFCNKLWNAARFALASINPATNPALAREGSGFGVQGSGFRVQELETTDNPPIPPDESKWSLADRWIVSRFNRTVEEANAALAAYRFDAYARACYDFFWRDFCDWYVEAIKPALKDPSRAGQTACVLAAVLDGSLRLVHPMIPFITETIWWHLNEVVPRRGLPGRIECKPSPRLIKAAWPTIGDFSQASEHIFPKIQEIIGAIRNIRNEYKVDQRKPVSVCIAAPAEPQRQIETNREMIELLATCVIKEVRADLPAPANAARATAAGCEIFVEGLIDANAEQTRSAKRREELMQKITTLRARKSNEAYMAKAPPHLVKQTEDQLAEAEAELAKLG